MACRGWCGGDGAVGFSAYPRVSPFRFRWNVLLADLRRERGVVLAPLLFLPRPARAASAPSACVLLPRCLLPRLGVGLARPALLTWSPGSRCFQPSPCVATMICAFSCTWVLGRDYLCWNRTLCGCCFLLEVNYLLVGCCDFSALVDNGIGEECFLVFWRVCVS